MRLPPELQSSICRDLNKAELKVARLVCKSFEQATVPFLFDEVFVADRYSDLDVADLVASRFGSHVKTLTLSSVEYKPLSMEEFRRKTEQRTATLPMMNGHLEHAFMVYCRAQKENLEIHQSGELAARLCLVLSKSPNIRRIVLTDYGNDSNDWPAPWLDSHDPWKEDDLCPFKVCNLSVSDHVDFHVRPTSPYQMAPNPFHLAMLAISAAKSTVTDLAMIHEGQEVHLNTRSTFLAKDTFEMTARQSYCLALCLQQLTSLELRLRDQERPAEAQGFDARRPIAEALAFAVNLGSLFIYGDVLEDELDLDGMTDLWTFLGDCRFPKLRSLALEFMNSEEDELLAFLKTSPCLKQLQFRWFELHTGSWESVEEKIRSALGLKSILIFDESNDDGFVTDLSFYDG